MGLSCAREEERCRQREQELKEKDTLIQDNLIRFSTFLQQQEQRKKKDEDLAKGEEIVRTPYSELNCWCLLETRRETKRNWEAKRTKDKFEIAKHLNLAENRRTRSLRQLPERRDYQLRWVPRAKRYRY